MSDPKCSYNGILNILQIHSITSIPKSDFNVEVQISLQRVSSPINTLRISGKSFHNNTSGDCFFLEKSKFSQRFWILTPPSPPSSTSHPLCSSSFVSFWKLFPRVNAFVFKPLSTLPKINKIKKKQKQKKSPR